MGIMANNRILPHGSKNIKEKRTADTAPDAPIDTNDGSLRRFIRS